MKTKIFTLLFVLAIGTPASAQAPAKKQVRPAQAPAEKAAPRARPQPAAAGIPTAITAALRLGVNIPTSELSSGFVPDVEVGYRIGMGEFAIEPAFGFQTFGGDAEGTVTSPQIGSGQAAYKQKASANIYEARVRGWFDLGDIGSPVAGINLGAVSASAEQDSFGVTREEADTALTWGLHAGWDYPIPAAHGNIELMLAYRQAAVDLVTPGDENLSGLQLMIGWHAAF